MSGSGSAPGAVRAGLAALLRGQVGPVDVLANALRVEAHGHTTFGRTDALDFFAGRPVSLSADAHVLWGPTGLVALDADAEGRPLGVYADLCGAVVNRVWVIGPTGPQPSVEPAVRVASDDFLTQLREPVHGDPADHPALAAAVWPHAVALGREALAEVRDPPAASSSHAVVVRAFSDGPAFAALYALRVQTPPAEPGLPRGDHRRWALAAGRTGADGALLHHRLAVSPAWPSPTPVLF